MEKQKLGRGFTLIELLVVISIISLLSSIVFASLNTAREKARDALRKGTLKQIANALEFYRDSYGTYAVNAGYRHNGYGYFSYSDGIANSYQTSIAERLQTLGYFGSLIKDPSGAVTTNGYMIYADTDHYTLWAHLERPSTADTNTQNSCYFSQYDSATDPTLGMNYCISSP